MSGDNMKETGYTTKNETEGSIGIGAMIVFIALILVAAVASTIIIKTAEELQQNAEQTSSDTRQQISGKVAILDAIVASTGDELVGNGDDHVKTFDVIWRVSSGSTGIYPPDISYYITCQVSNAAGAFFDTAELTAFGVLDETEIADTVELTAGSTYYTTVTLGDADDTEDNTLDASDTGTGCDATATQGASLNMRIVVDGGGETLTDLKIDSLTRGSSMM